MENASREYSYERLKELIECQKSEHGWEFIFLGANIDAAQTAGRFGIDKDKSTDFVADSKGVRLNYTVMSEALSYYRAGEQLSEDWKQKIEDDYKDRGSSH